MTPCATREASGNLLPEKWTIESDGKGSWVIRNAANSNLVLDAHAPTGCKRMVSGSISLPCSGFFSPFPHGTGSLSVSWEYLALPGGPGGFRQDSSCPALLRILLSLDVLACTSLSLSLDELSRTFQFTVI